MWWYFGGFENFPHLQVTWCPAKSHTTFLKTGLGCYAEMSSSALPATDLSAADSDVIWSQGLCSGYWQAELLSIKTIGPVRGRVQMSVMTSNANTTKTNLKANCKKQLIKDQRDRNGLKSQKPSLGKHSIWFLVEFQPPGGLASNVPSGCNVTETNPEDPLAPSTPHIPHTHRTVYSVTAVWKVLQCFLYSNDKQTLEPLQNFEQSHVCTRTETSVQGDPQRVRVLPLHPSHWSPSDSSICPPILIYCK